VFTARYSLTLYINRNFLLVKGLSKPIQCGLKLPEHDFIKLSFWFITYFDHVPAEICIRMQPTQYTV